MAEGARLEIVCTARYRGFESLSLLDLNYVGPGMKNFVHWAMWFDVVMSWKGRQKAVKLGSPVTPTSTPTIQMRVPFLLSPVLVAGAGGLRRPYWRVEENVNQ